MLDIQKALKKVIEKFIVNEVSLTSDISSGSTSIPVVSARRFQCNENVVIYDTETFDAEWATITDIPDKYTITIDQGLQDSYAVAGSKIKKLTGVEAASRQLLTAVYLGNPNVIKRFPAITVNAKNRSTEWLTLESVKETFDIEIGVYIRAADYELQYELMHAYTKAIESSLFRTLYPLAEPFDTTTLAEDVTPADKTIKLVNQEMLLCRLGWLFLENFDFLRVNRALSYLGNGVYQLARPVGRDFSAGDTVILPYRHLFNTLPQGTQYGVVNSQHGLLEAAVISWHGDEERRLWVPHRDSLTF